MRGLGALALRAGALALASANALAAGLDVVEGIARGCGDPLGRAALRARRRASALRRVSEGYRDEDKIRAFALSVSSEQLRALSDTFVLPLTPRQAIDLVDVVRKEFEHEVREKKEVARCR
jgi:hypothetical protein